MELCNYFVYFIENIYGISKMFVNIFERKYGCSIYFIFKIFVNK